MKKASVLFIVMVSLLFSACQPVKLASTATAAPAIETATEIPQVVSQEQPVKISGTFDYTNDIITTYYVEQAVALADMFGFVTRDRKWEIPVESQTLGFLQIDTGNLKGEYSLQLPAQPEGQFVDVDNNGQTDQGVQVFSVSYWPNLTSSPYSEGDDRSRGWPTYLASVKTDSENNDEVIGGSLVVWSPDANQQFPSGFGADGLLFTADDPVAPISAGYTVVSLDTAPFAFARDAQPQLALYEPKDAAVKDFSGDSYIVAFDKMFEIVRKEYAFNGIEGKQPDWDKVYAEIKPHIEEAETKNDPMAFYLAMRDFTWAFKDGHVSLNGGDYENQDFSQNYSGGFGFAMRELDDGRLMVVYVTPGGPADKIGMKPGAEILSFNGEAVSDAIGRVQPPSQPHSTDFSLRYQQVRYLLRTPVGTKADLRFSNPDEDVQVVSLVSVAENDSHRYTSIYKGFDANALPVEAKILDSGVGYIKINSNNDDLNLIIRLFERALVTFEKNKVPGIILDLRQNSGGAFLGLAGFLTDQKIEMGQLEYYSEKTGKFEPEGLRQEIQPNTNQYRFDKTVLMVDQACASACELEAYGFSQVPGVVVVGQYPSAGVEAEVARGQFKFPEGFSLQIPTGRFTLPDGSIFLEGQGVQPDLRVPIDENTVLSGEDEVLVAAERAVLMPLGAGVVPSGPPVFDGSENALNSVKGGTAVLEDLAREEYSELDYKESNKVFTYTITLNESQPVIWMTGWCAADEATLLQNFQNIVLKFVLDGQEIPQKDFYRYDYQNGNGQSCRAYLAELTDWPAGEHHLSTSLSFSSAINDGTNDYPVGTQVFDYAVYIKP